MRTMILPHLPLSKTSQKPQIPRTSCHAMRAVSTHSPARQCALSCPEVSFFVLFAKGVGDPIGGSLVGSATRDPTTPVGGFLCPLYRADPRLHLGVTIHPVYNHFIVTLLSPVSVDHQVPMFQGRGEADFLVSLSAQILCTPFSYPLAVSSTRANSE